MDAQKTMGYYSENAEMIDTQDTENVLRNKKVPELH